MSGKPSHKTVEAHDLIRSGMTPYRAAKTVGIALSTIYRHLRKLQSAVIEPPK